MFARMGPTPLKVAAVVAFVLVAGVVAAVNYEQILSPTKPALAQDEFDCASFNSQAEAQAELRRDPSDPSGLDGPIGTASDGTSGVACEVYPYDDPARDETPVDVSGSSPPSTTITTPPPTSIPKLHHRPATHLRLVARLHRLRHSHQGTCSTQVALVTDQYRLCRMGIVR